MTQIQFIFFMQMEAIRNEERMYSSPLDKADTKDSNVPLWYISHTPQALLLHYCDEELNSDPKSSKI